MYHYCMAENANITMMQNDFCTDVLSDLRLRYSVFSLVIHEVTKMFIDTEQLMTQSYQFEAMKNTLKSSV